jgi:NAD(P)H-dependent FMN reductase
MTLPHIQIIIGSIREGRVGEPVANWFAEHAAAREDLSTELVDLRKWNLPFLTNATPPSRGYETDLQREWAAKVGQADGYVLVTAEYNHGYPPPLKNALDHVYAEWARKPVAYVSYGGPGGGTRAVEQLRSVAVELQQAPLHSQVIISRPWPNLTDGVFDGRQYAGQATAVLDELAWWAPVLRAGRVGGGGR